MIKQMVLRNVDVDDDGSGQTQDQFCVDFEILEYTYPEQAKVARFSVNEFFHLACQYLEEHVDRVSDTGSAKIDVWY
jgi:hypothetical protein